MYSYRIEQAVRAASILHKDQMRKGIIPIPNISHLVAVCLILIDYTDDEDVVIAGLLHETLTSTDYTAEELRDDFGKSVQNIVLATHQKPGTKNLDWVQQKQLYVQRLGGASQETLLVSAADTIHTMRSTIEHYTNHHDRFLSDFEGSLEQRLMMYQNIANILNRSLNNDIMHEFNHVFEEYKKFITDVKKTNA